MKTTAKFLPMAAVAIFFSTNISAVAQTASESIAPQKFPVEESSAELQTETSKSKIENRSEMLPAAEQPSIKGEDKKKRSFLGKIGSFVADLLFGGEYPDGYTSF